jgi:hypothetical protein
LFASIRGFEIGVEFKGCGSYLSHMRRSFIWLLLAACFLAAWSARAATGRVIKVLPQFLDLRGRASLSPSLYERDAYQARLRSPKHTNEISGMVFQVEWKTKGTPTSPVKLRLETRGMIHGNTPEAVVLEMPVKPGGWFPHWTAVPLSPEEYRKLGAVTAWRVTLWDGDQLLGEQLSFLW